MKYIKRIICFLLIITSVILFNNCTSLDSYNKLEAKMDSILIELDNKRDTVNMLRQSILNLEDSISVLSYPASQRYLDVLNLIKQNQLDSALIAINNLKLVFPNSNETSKIYKQEKIISDKKKAIKAEEERILSMGFKYFKDNSYVAYKNSDDELLNLTFNNYRFDREFIFDYIEDIDEYHYYTADKDDIYVLLDMKVNTKLKSVITPTLYLYEIVGGKARKLNSFSEEYESWESYGAYIGNYEETSHDYNKVNTVRYRLASEISLEDSNKALLILIKNKSCEEKFDDDLSITDIKNHFIVVKIINRHKL